MSVLSFSRLVIVGVYELSMDFLTTGQKRVCLCFLDGIATRLRKLRFKRDTLLRLGFLDIEGVFKRNSEFGVENSDANSKCSRITERA